MVYADSLKVRSTPSADGKKIRSLAYGDIIYTYEIKGSGQWKNGTLDKWCRITPASEKQQEWVNFYYVIQFPFAVGFPGATNYSTEPKDFAPDDYLHIKDIEEKDGAKIFISRIDDRIKYYPDLKYYEIPFAEEVNSLKIMDNPEVRKHYFISTFDKFLNGVYEGFYDYKNGKILSDKAVLEYGIKIGMDKDTLLGILGTPTENDKKMIKYIFSSSVIIEFSLENNKITGISKKYSYGDK